MSSVTKIAIVAALEREVRPLLKRWHSVEREYEGRQFKFFESGESVLVCGGIGAEAARRATEAVIALYRPGLVQCQRRLHCGCGAKGEVGRILWRTGG
jgi:nucleoside phosphorylase